MQEGSGTTLGDNNGGDAFSRPMSATTRSSSTMPQHEQTTQQRRFQQQQHEQTQHQGLMGIAHRHDDALAHNPTPSETLMDHNHLLDEASHGLGGEEPPDGSSSSDVGTGTLGAAPSPLLLHDRRSSSSSSQQSVPQTILPAKLFGLEAAAGSAALPPVPSGGAEGGKSKAGSGGAFRALGNPSRIFQHVSRPPPQAAAAAAAAAAGDGEYDDGGGGDCSSDDESSSSSSSYHSPLEEDEDRRSRSSRGGRRHLDAQSDGCDDDGGGVDGSSSSDVLVRMLMRSSPNNRKRQRRGGAAGTGDDSLVDVEDDATDDGDIVGGGDGYGDDDIGGDSDSSGGPTPDGAKLSLGGSKYDYDMNWDMVGHGRRMMVCESSSGDGGAGGERRSEEDGGGRLDEEAAPAPASVAAAAVAASAAVAAAVRNDGAEGSGTSAALASAARPVTPTESHAFDSDDAGTAWTSRSAEDAAVAQQGPRPRQQQHTQLVVPSSPIHYLPRRRTRSSPEAPILYYATSSSQSSQPPPPPLSRTGRQRHPNYGGRQRTSHGDLSAEPSEHTAFDPEEFDDVCNLDSRDRNKKAPPQVQQQKTSVPSDSAGTRGQTRPASSGDIMDIFDDFAGTPALNRTVSDGGDGASRSVIRPTESVASGSSSSSSSVTHRRRRRGLSLGSSSHLPPPGHLGPEATVVAGGQAAASVSSFSASLSSASVAQHGPLRARPRSGGADGDGSASRSNGSAAEADSSSGGSNRAARSLRTSLDAGMAAMRRWARSHAGVAGTAAASAAQAGGRGPPRPSRAATLQLGEEDLFALTHAGEDPRRSVSALEEEAILRHDVFGMGRLGVFPPPIAEEDEAVPAGRHRAFSEPDQARVRNFFSRRAISSTIQQHNAPPSQEMVRQSSSIGRFGRRRRTGQQQQPEGGGMTTTADDLQAGSTVIPPLSASSEVASSVRSLSSAAISSSLFHSHQAAPQDRGSVDEMDLLESGHGVRASSANDNPDGGDDEARHREVDGDVPVEAGEGGGDDAGTGVGGVDADPNRQARSRWIRINRRFQLIITIVALIFSLLLFAILVCWVVLTSAYVVSIDKPCDVPLKKYFWLATLQLIFDVFRSDIMRFILRWDSNSRQRIPMRVVLYNISYLTYAMLVLRLGVKSVFMSDEATCPTTAPELFQTSAAFVALSLAAWSTIVVGYLGPFCFVAVILTRNGYSPSADFNGSNDAANGGVLPGVFPTYSNNGAPPECIDRLRVVLLDEFPDEYPKECCICMADFVAGEVIVVTECEHVFHKRCCQEWLRQARTCPVCRTDIPTALGVSEDGSDGDGSVDGTRRREGERPNRPPLNREEFHMEVVSLLRLLRQNEARLRDRLTQQDDREEDEEAGSMSGTSANATSQAETTMSNEERAPTRRSD